ncbi:MAG: cation:proton antiporter [Oscillatoriophycideae cyanobacterium NC_groundwater_1537_Pr4_S-0.65um_50_18]|nr:cation:proton antiporter [Oscillatoriophycideae cyanobacterium NC_groundwater_1537_Pr4_S-0.65um_50_18]
MHLEPIVSFAILLAVILIVPLCFERIKLPGLLGLLLAGVALGPNGLQILQSDSDTMSLLSDIGLIYLLFVCGLEIDLDQFQATKYRSAGYGFLTFIVPLITGTVVGRVFGFDWNASVLIGSLFASHTLLAYPIISRLGVVNNEAIVVTIGATIFTDVGSLLVLAICIGINKGDFNAFELIRLLLSLLIYSTVILFGFAAVGKEFFRRSGNDEGNQFLFVLLAVFVAALGAEVIGVEKIVGAFLAGLAVNSVMGDSPIKEKILFVGSVLFIPIFFVDLGLLIDVPAFIKSISSIWLTLTIVLGLIGSKFLAALFAKLAYRYSWREAITMWSLSMPQVAATLAATFVGYRAGMLTEDVLNSVIVLMLVTATLGPLITARAASGLVSEAGSGLLTDWNTGSSPDSSADPDAKTAQALTLVVPIYNPQTERNLIEMATLLAQHQSGRVVPLAVVIAHGHMDTLELASFLVQSQSLLDKATEVCQEFGLAANPLLRIDDDVAQGISYASREQQASLVIMGWSKTTGFRARLFGNIIDRVLWASHCPVAVTRLLDSPRNIKRILVPLGNPTQRMIQVMNFAAILAEANQAEVTLLHISDRRISPAQMDAFKSQMELFASQCAVRNNPTIQIIAADDVATAIVTEAQKADLVVMRSARRRVNVNELSISDLTTQVITRLHCSVVMLGEPQHRPRPILRRNPQATTSTNTGQV